jgi:glycosyltransferase involved in cell wall biosynthesis
VKSNRIIKILWFTNTPSLAEEKLSNKPVGGGWIKSLEKEIKEFDNIELGIAFYYNKNIIPFNFNGVKYYPFENGTKLQKLYNRFRVRIEPGSDLEKFSKVVNDFNPDVIHIHGTENPFGLIANKVNIPVVVSIQGNIIICHHKFFSGIEERYAFITVGLKNFLLRNSFHKTFRRFTLMKNREEKLLRNCINVVGRTKWDKRISSVLAPDSNYFHNDEILRDTFYKREWNKERSETIVIHITTSNSLYKGLETVCSSINLLINNKKLNIKCQVAGLHENDLIVKVVKKKLKDVFPKDNIISLGKLNEVQLVESMLRADIFVLPSHIENSPNSLCEAMMLGMPCIATHAGGSNSLLEDAKEGILIQAGDPWSMAGAILEMYNNYDIAIQYGQNARKRALARHDPQKITNGLIDIYEKVIRDNHVQK